MSRHTHTHTHTRKGLHSRNIRTFIIMLFLLGHTLETIQMYINNSILCPHAKILYPDEKERIRIVSNSLDILFRENKLSGRSIQTLQLHLYKFFGVCKPFLKPFQYVNFQTYTKQTDDATHCFTSTSYQ